MGIENRQGPRLPYSIPIEISYLDPLGETRHEPTSTIEISASGARFPARCVQKPGTQIHLSIPHLGRSAYYRVVWCLPPPMVNGLFDVGVQIEPGQMPNVWNLH